MGLRREVKDVHVQSTASMFDRAIEYGKAIREEVVMFMTKRE